MELWQSLLVAFGGNAALLLVLGFLGRSLLSSVLAKDVETFKADLQLATIEHQVRFTKLHDRRAEVLAELYELLVQAFWDTSSLTNPFQFVGSPDNKTRYTTATTAIAAYFRFFERHRIWLPEPLCARLEDFAKQLRKPVIDAGVYLDVETPTPEAWKEKHEVLAKAWESVQKDIPALRLAIESEFRKLLDASRTSG